LLWEVIPKTGWGFGKREIGMKGKPVVIEGSWRTAGVQVCQDLHWNKELWLKRKRGSFITSSHLFQSRLLHALTPSTSRIGRNGFQVGSHGPPR
jgi:hypothetical protein